MRKLGFQALSTAWKYSVKNRLTRSLCFHRENTSLLFQFSPLFSQKKLAHVTKEYSPKHQAYKQSQNQFLHSSQSTREACYHHLKSDSWGESPKEKTSGFWLCLSVFWKLWCMGKPAFPSTKKERSSNLQRLPIPVV